MSDLIARFAVAGCKQVCSRPGDHFMDGSYCKLRRGSARGTVRLRLGSPAEPRHKFALFPHLAAKRWLPKLTESSNNESFGAAFPGLIVSPRRIQHDLSTFFFLALNHTRGTVSVGAPPRTPDHVPDTTPPQCPRQPAISNLTTWPRTETLAIQDPTINFAPSHERRSPNGTRTRRLVPSVALPARRPSPLATNENGVVRLRRRPVLPRGAR